MHIYAFCNSPFVLRTPSANYCAWRRRGSLVRGVDMSFATTGVTLYHDKVTKACKGASPLDPHSIVG